MINQFHFLLECRISLGGLSVTLSFPIGFSCIFRMVIVSITQHDCHWCYANFSNFISLVNSWGQTVELISFLLQKIIEIIRYVKYTLNCLQREKYNIIKTYLINNSQISLIYSSQSSLILLLGIMIRFLFLTLSIGRFSLSLRPQSDALTRAHFSNFFFFVFSF